MLYAIDKNYIVDRIVEDGRKKEFTMNIKPKKYTKQFLVLTTPEEYEILKEMVENDGVSISQFIREKIKEEQKQRGIFTKNNNSNQVALF